MEARRFDDWTRRFGTMPRRAALGRGIAGLVAATGIGLGAPEPAAGFGLPYHEEITRRGLAGLVDDQAMTWIIGKFAPLCVGNRGTDCNQVNPALHFDSCATGQDFCARWAGGIDEYLNRAVFQLMPYPSGQGDGRFYHNWSKFLLSRQAGLQYFGNAIHSLQDFYSHSTWVDLGRTATAPLTGPTCNPAAFQAPLQTGYYALQWIAHMGNSGCPVKGPPSQFTYCHSAINKDTPTSVNGRRCCPAGSDPCGKSGTCHEVAKAIAARATAEAWAELDRRIRARLADEFPHVNAECWMDKIAHGGETDCGDTCEEGRRSCGWAGCCKPYQTCDPFCTSDEIYIGMCFDPGDQCVHPE